MTFFLTRAVGAQDYNGKVGRITGREGERYLVQLDVGNQLKVKASNLDTHVE